MLTAFAAFVALIAAGPGVGVMPQADAAAAQPELFAFGDNQYGQLGSATGAGTLNPNATPSLASLPGAAGPVAQAAAGADHTLAVTSTGQLYAFGENRYGQLGSPANAGSEASDPIPAPVTLPAASGVVTQVAAGYAHSVALTSTGQVYAFGNNYYGQLGDAGNVGTANASPTPAPVVLPGASGPVRAVAAGDAYSLALTSTGELYAFGENRYGQLGSETNNGTSEANPTPAIVSLPGATGPVTQIAAGAYHSLALTSTGQLYAFGENRYGQLASKANNGTSEANPTPTIVSLPGATGPVAQIAAGAYHSLALTSSGQLYAFGENNSGQLGNEMNEEVLTSANPTPALVQLPATSGGVIQIAAGAYCSLVLTSTGQLYGFGDNRYGQLQETTIGEVPTTGTTFPNPTPAALSVSAHTAISAVGSGAAAAHTLVIASDGLGITTGSPLPADVVGAPYRAQVQASGGGSPYHWSASGLPPGLGIDPASGIVSGAPVTPGIYTASVTVADAYGVIASASLSLTIRAAAPAAPAASPLAPPTITAARESAAGWREGSHLARISSKQQAPRPKKKQPPIGTTFSFSLNEPASIGFSFTQILAGRKVGKRCVAPLKASARHKMCRRTLAAGSFSFAGHQGLNRVVFEGRISRSKELDPGRYRLTITATNSAGGHAAPASLSFTIVSR